jgi:hypothetical protein
MEREWKRFIWDTEAHVLRPGGGMVPDILDIGACRRQLVFMFSRW